MESKDESNNIQNKPHSLTQIVCLYAQRDEPFYRELQTHMILWHTKGQIRWLEITPGADVEQTLLAFVQQADLILLLISPSFFAKMVFHKTMESALAEHIRRSVLVVPIVVRAFDWKESACGGLKALPDNERPIAEWEHQERAYENIRAGLARLLPALSPETGTQPTRPRLFQASDLPKGYVPRPKAFDEIKRKLLSQRGGQTTAITTALRGAGGFGKTTLALALCHDAEIQTAFPDGILWIELGEQPTRALDLLNGLLSSLEPSLSGAITLEEARDRWHRTLNERVCLLVIDDVWQTLALEPLLEGGPRCVRLITTRNDQVLPEETARVWVDAMEPEEAIAVLSRGLLDEIQQGAYQTTLETLAKRLGCWPLLLTLAHGMLASLVNFDQSITEALRVVEEAYQTRGVTAFHLGHARKRQQTADTCLKVSLQHLEDFTHAHYQAAARYQELAVFPKDIDIPIATLQILWKGTGHLEPWETKDLCMQLHRLSLLLTCDLGKGTIRLHDVMRSYLVQSAGSGLPGLHARLLDLSQQLLGLNRWSALPSDEHYLWQYLTLHLCSALRLEELQAMLTDLGYLTRKALYVSVPALEADLLLAHNTFQQTDGVESARTLFEFLHRTIVRLSHLLRQVHTSAEVGGLLLSHLGSHPLFAIQRHALERELPRPFFTTWHPLPGESSSALLRTLHGHTDGVLGCAVSPDGSFIVSASSDNTLKVWDVTTGVERLCLTGHTSAINDCTVSPDGDFIISASYDGTLKVWEAATGIERLSLTGHTDGVLGCAVSPDGSFIVSASSDGTLKVWEATTGAERLSLTGHTSAINDCAVGPDGDFIVSTSYDGTLKVWEVATGAERFSLTSHTDGVLGCAVSPDGSFIVSASSDGTLKVWEAATGSERLCLTGHTSVINDCAVSPDGLWIVSASTDSTLKVWDVTTGAERFSFTDHTSAVYSCAVSPDGRWIASASWDKTLKVWDAATGVQQPSLRGHTHWVRGCAVSSDGSLVVSASDDTTLKVWNTATGVERFSLRGHTSVINNCAVSPDGSFIVSASSDGTLKVWDAVTGAECFSLLGHAGFVRDCAVSPDGHWIVSASGDKTLKVWDVVTGVERLSLQGHTSEVHGCAVSSDGRWIISASADSTLKVWDAANGVEHLSLQGHTSEVYGCAVSSDGRWIISASADSTLKVWDAANGVQRLSFQSHASAVYRCAISSDGRWVLSASDDKTLKLWDAQRGQCMLTFPVDGPLFGCAFHPDGEHLVACGAQGVYFLRVVR